MENVDLEVLSAAADWVEKGTDVVLATVAKTWGSSPRPAGSMMIWQPGGRFLGSLSGGCIEEELLAKYSSKAPARPVVIEYGISKEQAVSRGLPCGGEVTVVVESLRDAAVFSEMLARLGRREVVARAVNIDSGSTSLQRPANGTRTNLEGNELLCVYQPKWRLLVIGAGQLSSFVTKMADILGYEVIVCDPRENYRDAWLADDIELDAAMPDDFISAQACDEQTAVVALTHDPKLDDLAIMEALNSAAFYVGALGSSRTNGARRQRLAEHFEVSAERLDFMSGPIGIDLNTRTASEIALAVMTEITARRNGVRLISERPTAPTAVAS